MNAYRYTAHLAYTPEPLVTGVYSQRLWLHIYAVTPVAGGYRMASLCGAPNPWDGRTIERKPDTLSRAGVRITLALARDKPQPNRIVCDTCAARWEEQDVWDIDILDLLGEGAVA